MSTATQELNTIQLSETSYMSVEELIARLNSGELNYCPQNYYIRSKVQENSKPYQEALSTFDLDTGEIIYQILFPVTIFRENGKEYLVNGNNRVANLVFMYSNSTDADKARFAPIPYNYILNAPITEEILLSFQKYANDTTVSHSVIDRLIKANSYYNSQYAKYKKSGQSETDSKAKAQMDVRRALGKPSEPLSQPQFSKVTSVAKACLENQLLKTYIENGQVGIEAANSILVLHKKLIKKKGNEDLSLDFVLISIMALTGDSKKNDLGLSVIEPKHIAQYEESVKPVEVRKEKEQVKPAPTIDMLADDGLITEDLRGEIQDYLKQYDGKVEERELVHEIVRQAASNPIDSESVKKAIRSLKLEVTITPISEVINSRQKYFDRVERIDYQGISENTTCSNKVADFCEKGLKLITKTNRYFTGGESKEILEPVLKILYSRISAIDSAIADAPEQNQEIKEQLDALTNMLEVINNMVTANSSPSSEEISITDDEDEEDDNSDVFGDDPESVTATEEGYTATIELE